MRQLPVRTHDSLPKLKRALFTSKNQVVSEAETTLVLHDCDELVLNVGQLTNLKPSIIANDALYPGKRVLVRIVNQIGTGIANCKFIAGSPAILPVNWQPFLNASNLIMELIFSSENVWYVNYIGAYESGSGVTLSITEITN